MKESSLPDRIDSRVMTALVQWFGTCQRSMPWRGETDPYRIWVSEVMLQQTQVATVIKYYRNWMHRFPTITALAEADLESVLMVWEGLGYYSRARNLLKGARFIRDTFNGHFPVDRNRALTIPGVGDYIAGALLSIAFNLPEPAIDGNVIRVMTRFLAWDADTGRTAFRRRLRSLLSNSYYALEPRWVNQALMELGALVCTPIPRCTECPLKRDCTARRIEAVDRFPRKKKRLKVPTRKGVIFLIRSGERILMVRRPATGLLSGLWELPNCMSDEIDPSTFMVNHGLSIAGTALGTVSHAYSHFKVQFTVQPAVLKDGWSSEFWIDFCWRRMEDLAALPKPGVHIKALKLAGL